jgi:hypothetical protein
MSDVCICICLYIYIYILWASSCRYFLAREGMRQCIYGTSCKITIFEELCVPSAGPPPKTSSGIPSGQDVSEKWRHGVTHTLVSVYGFVLIRVRTIFGWLEAGKLERADVHWACQEDVWRAFHAKRSLLVLDLCNPINHVACTLNHEGYKVLEVASETVRMRTKSHLRDLASPSPGDSPALTKRRSMKSMTSDTSLWAWVVIGVSNRIFCLHGWRIWCRMYSIPVLRR